MSSEIETRMADVSPPIALDTDIQNSGVASRSITNASVLYEIPSAWKGKIVDFKTTGACQLAFGDSGLSLTYDERSALASAALTMDVNTGWPYAADEKDSFRIPRHKTITHFAVVGPSSSSGGWFMRLSENLLVDELPYG